jgi:hypothetical protein
MIEALLAGSGSLAIGAAIAWWAILFPEVVENTGLSLGYALPCIALNSDVCSLAMSICRGRHLFGISHYSTNLFWIGVVLLSASLLISSVPARADR